MLSFIRELGHLRESGVSYLALTPETAWWLDHFDGLRDYLEEAHDVLPMEGQSPLFSLPGQ